MAEVCKREYHLIPPGGEACDWLDDRDEAVRRAKEGGEGWSVEEVVSFFEERTTVWPPEDEDDG